MSQKAKRVRTPNFTEEEKGLLLMLINKKKNIIEGKASNSLHWKDKEEAWENIVESFNAQTPGTARSVQSLKVQYKNMKENVRKIAALERNAAKSTGGGPILNLKKDSNYEFALAMLNEKTVVGMDAEFGGDDSSDEENMEQINATVNKPDHLQNVIVLSPKIDSDPTPVIDWGRYTTKHLKSPVSIDLLTKNTEIENVSESAKPTVLQQKVPSNRKTTENCHKKNSWKSRTITSVLHSSNISEYYEELAKAKLLLVNSQLEIEKREHEERMKESKLKQELLKLEIEMKKAELMKINRL